MHLAAFGTQEMLLVLVAFLLLFGANRIPQMFRGLGEGMKEFKKATRDLADDDEPAPSRRDDAPKSTESRDETTHASASK